MGKITDISRQKRVKTRFNVFIDGEFVCGLDEVTVASARLAIGDEITEPELKKLVFASETSCAFDRAVSYLSAVPRSRKEIYLYLTGKGYDRSVAEEALSRLDSYRYTNDRAYAETYIKSKSNRYGKLRLRADLKQKGVDSSIIDELLDETDEDAVGAARKYLRTHRSADLNKLKRFLAGRGYSWDCISAAVSEVRQELIDEDNDHDDSEDM